MDWLDVNAVPLAIGLGLLAAVLAVWGFVGGRGKLLIAAGCCAVLAGLAVAAKAVIVTEAERVEATVAELADAVVAGDADAAVAYFTRDAVFARAAVRAGLGLVDVADDVRLTDFRTAADGDEATCHFRANATFTLLGKGFEGRRPTRWRTRWRKVGDDWRIARVIRLNPITGEELGFLDRE